MGELDILGKDVYYENVQGIRDNMCSIKEKNCQKLLCTLMDVDACYLLVFSY
jgi:hypothetical protein